MDDLQKQNTRTLMVKVVEMECGVVMWPTSNPDVPFSATGHRNGVKPQNVVIHNK